MTAWKRNREHRLQVHSSSHDMRGMELMGKMFTAASSCRVAIIASMPTAMIAATLPGVVKAKAMLSVRLRLAAVIKKAS